MTQQPDSTILSRVLQIWGTRLKRVDPQLLPAVPALPRTRALLTNVGVPVDAPLDVTFYSGPTLLQELAANGTRYWQIGDDYGTKLVLDEREQVWSLGDGELPLRFVGSSLAAVVLFLGLYASQMPALKKASDEVASGLIDELRKEFRAADSAALANAENWWSVVLEQVALGLG